jgi:hypothetical protein
MEALSAAIESLREINWNDPKVSVVLSLLALLSIFRKWRLVVMLLLLVALGKGLRYFLVTEGMLGDRVGQICMVFYLMGGIFIFIVAVIQFFFSEK